MRPKAEPQPSEGQDLSTVTNKDLAPTSNDSTNSDVNQINQPVKSEQINLDENSEFVFASPETQHADHQPGAIEILVAEPPQYCKVEETYVP